MLSTLLSCEICGSRTPSEGLCSGCGAQRGERVALPECEPDGLWIVAGRGSSEQVLKQLARTTSLNPGPHGAARLSVLRRLLKAFPVQGQVEVRLDLRGAEVGGLHSQRRRGNSRETFHRLPWLWLRAIDLEASVTRTLHRKVTRTFRAGVESSATRFELDELRLQTAQGGVRRPFKRPSSLAGLGPQDLEPSVPGLDEPLWPSAPGVGGEAPRGTAAALVAAAALLIVAPWFLSPSPRVEVLRTDAQLKLGSAEHGEGWRQVWLPVLPAEPRAVRHALEAEDPHQRRAALTQLGALPRAERWRALSLAARDPFPDVRDPALEGLSESPLGTASLAELAQSEETSLEARVRSFELLRSAAPTRARQIALTSSDGAVPARLRRAWVLALGELCEAGDAEAVEVLSLVVAHASPAIAAAGARALVSLAPQAAKPLLPLALQRALSEKDERALVTLGRAHRDVGGERAILADLAQNAELSRRTRRRLRALAR